MPVNLPFFGFTILLYGLTQVHRLLARKQEIFPQSRIRFSGHAGDVAGAIFLSNLEAIETNSSRAICGCVFPDLRRIPQPSFYSAI